jgi:hypothetical protein
VVGEGWHREVSPYPDHSPPGAAHSFREVIAATGRGRRELERAEVWGRPAALAVAKDGSLLVADDTGGTIWRISYSKTAEQAGAPAERTGSEAKPR